MIRAPRFTLELSECRDTALVGGKAANLGRLVRTGFPVPAGFVVTTRAWEERSGQRGRGGLDGQSGQDRTGTGSTSSTLSTASIPSTVAEEIRSAYRTLGTPVVAVRSSATAEDTAAASMAGQYETFLHIQGEQALLDAIERCWASLKASRVQAYLREHGIDPARVAMAVLVQRQVPADVAGVLFTMNPQDGHSREMLLEASWGLGEMVVSGRVQPDVLRLERDTGRVLEAIVADKQVCLAGGAAQERAVEEGCRRRSCLRGREVYRLWQLARAVAEHFGCPQDIEWAIHEGQPFLLQSRPITTLADAAAREEVLCAARRRLREQAAAGRGPWVLHNLAETLPHPTPLTWSLMQRFMSGSGGFGAMYRQAGFEPAPAVEREGFLECVAGRIYMDVTRGPEMLWADFPFAYDLEELKRNPDAAQTPPTLPRGSAWSRAKAGRRLRAVRSRLDKLSGSLEHELRAGLFEEMTAFVAGAKRLDLRSFSVQGLLELWEGQERKILEVFGPRLLLPGLVTAMALGELRTFLQEVLWDEDPDALARSMSAGGPPDRTLLANAELYEVAQGSRSLEAWLAGHGHRAAGELELAQPRWRERPEAVREMAERLGAGAGPLDRRRRNIEEINQQAAAVRARLSRGQRREFDRLLDLVRRHVALREDSKDFLLLGYDLLRDLAREAGRRLEVDEGVFYLTREELFDSLRVGFAPHYLIEQRKIAYRAESRLTLPRVIDAQAIATLGEAPAVEPSADGHKALAVSSGEARGPAKIVRSPTDAGDLGHGYILVCPSTDPSWTPLFVHAAGLVLECGGTLSHGAVVARELGLPAVVLPEATKLFCDGQELHVDGRGGWVGPVCSDAVRRSPDALTGTLQAADDTSISRDLLPPPVGRKDRQAARLSRGLALAWGIYLLAFFALPQRYVHQPTVRVLDFILWPLACALGKPAVVAVVAAGVAVVTLLVQRVVTDNRRLREAKRRAAVLKRQAELLPKDAPTGTALLRPAAQVQVRTLVAALIPVGMLLGPMVLPFVWFRERVAPAAWNAPAGSAVQLVALVDSDWSEPVRIEVPAPVSVDGSTPVARTLPPLRATLEHLLVLYRQPSHNPNEPWELGVAPDLGREQTANDLQAYLEAGLPPQGVTWLLRAPDDLSGRFSVTVTAGKHPPVSASVVWGDRLPPAPNCVAGPADSPIKELRVVYPKPREEPVFWRPLVSLGGRMATLDVGWLWLYLLVYLPVLILVRAVLKVA